jgi:hypothetical protein
MAAADYEFNVWPVLQRNREQKLALLLILFDRLIEQAWGSLAEEKINIFD